MIQITYCWVGIHGVEVDQNSDKNLAGTREVHYLWVEEAAFQGEEAPEVLLEARWDNWAVHCNYWVDIHPASSSVVGVGVGHPEVQVGLQAWVEDNVVASDL